MARGFYLGGNMKKYIILVLLLVIILISAFFVLKINQTNDLYISFNINNEIYEMGVTPVVTLEDLENLKEQQILVKRDMESVVFDSLKDGVYRVYLSLENKIFEEKEISIKNNEFLKLSQKHSIAFLVEVPRKIQKFEMTVLDNTPELKWKTKGAVVPDKYIISDKTTYGISLCKQNRITLEFGAQPVYLLIDFPYKCIVRSYMS